jgi:hypothetical protein
VRRHRSPSWRSWTALPPGSGPWWRRWVLHVSAGELAGFSVPLVLGVVVRASAPAIQLAVLVLAGMVEGAVVGAAQAGVLRGHLAGFRGTAWVVATSAAAGLAWLLGMLPSLTHPVWSTWPVAGVAVAGSLLGGLLLCSIGAAQAWVLPAGTPRPSRWIWWTAGGWCAGLVAFGVVAPPLWHEGQAAVVSALIGLAGGAAMALVMAGVTGVGMARLCARARAPRAPGSRAGTVSMSTLVGTRVRTPEGRDLGQVRDLVVDLAGGLDRAPVTGVVIGARRHPDRVAAWDDLSFTSTSGAWRWPEPAAERGARAATEVLVRRDILDCPVVLLDPPRRARVSDVFLDLGEDEAWVTGVDVSTSGAVRRLLPRATTREAVRQVPLSEVHLGSTTGHRAQLAAPDAMVFGLPPHEMAEVLTRVPVAHGRDIVRAADAGVVDRALPALHPHVRSRLTVAGPAPRRTRRTAGWLLHRPQRPGGPRPGNAPPGPTGRGSQGGA